MVGGSLRIIKGIVTLQTNICGLYTFYHIMVCEYLLYIIYYKKNILR